MPARPTERGEAAIFFLPCAYAGSIGSRLSVDEEARDVLRIDVLRINDYLDPRCRSLTSVELKHRLYVPEF